MSNSKYAPWFRFGYDHGKNTRTALRSFLDYHNITRTEHVLKPEALFAVQQFCTQHKGISKDYLGPNFDASDFTIAELQQVFAFHDIKYDATLKKKDLVKFFYENIHAMRIVSGIIPAYDGAVDSLANSINGLGFNAPQQQAAPIPQQQAAPASQEQAAPTYQQQAAHAPQEQAAPTLQQQATLIPQQYTGPAPHQYVDPAPQQYAGPIPYAGPATQQHAGPAPPQYTSPAPQQYIAHAPQQQQQQQRPHVPPSLRDHKYGNGRSVTKPQLEYQQSQHQQLQHQQLQHQQRQHQQLQHQQPQYQQPQHQSTQQLQPTQQLPPYQEASNFGQPAHYQGHAGAPLTQGLSTSHCPPQQLQSPTQDAIAFYRGPVQTAVPVQGNNQASFGQPSQLQQPKCVRFAQDSPVSANTRSRGTIFGSNYRQPTAHDESVPTNIENAFLDVAEIYQQQGSQVAAQRLRQLANQVEVEGLQGRR